MNSEQFIKDALRTESTDGLQERTVRAFPYLVELRTAVRTIDSVDRLKRFIAYGTEMKNEGNLLPESFGKDAISLEKARLLHAGLGMLTEAAEFLEPVLYSILEREDIDRVNLLEEIGDSQWYQALACDVLGGDFETIQRTNIAKLKQRFPEKFTQHHAENRDLDAEREVLEGKE